MLCDASLIGRSFLLSLSFSGVDVNRRILRENESDIKPRNSDQRWTTCVASVWGITRCWTKIRENAVWHFVNIIGYGECISGLYPYGVNINYQLIQQARACELWTKFLKQGILLTSWWYKDIKMSHSKSTFCKFYD